MTSVRRQTPLRADELDAPPIPPTPPATVSHPPVHERSEGDRRAFREAVLALRTAGTSLNLSEHTLMILAGIVAPLGLIVVLLGWYGAAHTSNLFEQVPYLISGGLFGLGLVFLGGFFYFAHWLTEMVQESRSSSAALLDAIGRLQESIDRGTAPGRAIDGPGAVTEDAVDLVATGRGSMAHRLDCPVVSGKHDLRPVTLGDGLAGCKMCDPYVAGRPDHAP